MARKRRKGRTRKPSFRRRLVKWLLILAGMGILLAVLCAGALFWYFSHGLADIHTIDDYAPKQVTRVYSADGELIDLWVDEEVIYRTVVPFEAIPEVMRQAILAAEDAEFYHHGGLDVPGVLRAIYANLRTSSFSQGASTITQQVVKNLLLTPERSIRRKVQEVLLAFRLEDRLSKDEILAIYLNEVYFGCNRYGVEEAARHYLGKPSSELGLAESALLAGLVQSPARYDPFRHPEAALERRSYVLRQMWQKGFIEESAYRDALEEPLVLAENAYPYLDTAPYFSDAVRQILFDELGRATTLTAGLSVTTTLRLNHQRAAERAVHIGLTEYDGRHHAYRPRRHLPPDELEAFRREHAPVGGIEVNESYEVIVLETAEDRLAVGLGPRELELLLVPLSRINPEGRPIEELYAPGDVLSVRAGASATLAELAADPAKGRLRFEDVTQAGFIAMDPHTRQVTALVGGYDHAQSSFNRATQARRPSGSAFKPFIYGAALNERLVTPASIVRDEPTPFRLPGGRMWNPQNSDGEYLGAMTLREALARSRNVVSVRLLDQLGLDRAQAFARQAGIESDMVDNLTMALGSSEIPLVELVNGYATLASGGWVNPPIMVTRVTDHLGNLVFSQVHEPQRGIDAAVAHVVVDLMTSVIDHGTGSRANALGRPAAGKTGTTNEARDAWFVGFVPQLLAGAWVGFDDYRPMGRGEYGGRAALPIWLQFMQDALAGEPVESFPAPPPGVVTRLIDPVTGLLAQPGDPDAIDEIFIAGTQPTRYAPESARNTSPGSTQGSSGTVEGGGSTDGYDDF